MIQQKDRPDREKMVIDAVLDVLLDDDFEVVELSGRMACEIADLIKPKILALFPDIEELKNEWTFELGEVARQATNKAVEEAKREERERIKSLALQAIADEPEFPSDMPDELWKEIAGDREITQRVMQNTVRIIKRDIIDRFLEALKEGGE